MALVNPNIAMSFRAPEIQQPNMLADYAAIQQIQGGQQAQQLNALKIQEYERARGEEEGARNFLRGRDLASPDTRAGLTQFGKTGLALAKSLSEQDAATLSMQNVKSQISERDFGLQDKKLKFAWGAIGDSATPALAIEKITGAIKDGVFKPEDGAAEIQQLQNMTPEAFRQYRVNKVLQLLDAKDKLGAMLPKIARQEAGGQILSIQDNPALPGYGLPVAGMAAIAKTETFADKNARQRLAFDQNKFNWEKANPGMELKEDENGNLFGINKRTLQVTPVTMGGGAPSAGGVGADAGKPFKGKDASKTAVSEQQAAYNVGRVLTAAKQINEIGRDDPSAVQPGGVEALAASVGMSGTANLARNANRQIIFGAQRDALDALLYLATGAAYNKEQLEGKVAAYIPSYTDKPENVIAKQERMTELIKSAKIRAGKSWTPEMDVAMKALTSPPAPAAAAAPRVAPPAGFTPD